MKKTVLACAFAVASPCFASDFALSFSMPSGLSLFDGIYIAAHLDIDLGTRYLPVNGGLELTSGTISPATGTCFITTDGGAFCNLQVDHLSVTLDLGPNLTGTALVKSASGEILSSAFIFVD